MISDEYDDVADEPVGGTRWKLVFAILSFSVLAFACWSVWPSPPPKPPEGVKQADYDKAAQEFSAKAHRRAEHSDTLVTLAESAMRRNRVSDAMKLLEQIPFSDAQNGQGALRRRAQLALKDNRIEVAESALTELLKRAEADGTTDTDECRFAKEMLGFIYAIELRFHERRQIMSKLREEVLLEPLLAAQFHFPALIPWRSPQQRERLMEFLEKDPGNLRLLVAYARHLTGEGRTDDAEKLLAVVLQQHPKDLSAIAARAECFYAKSQWDELQTLLKSAPAFEASEPWLLTQMRAESASQVKNWKEAESYFDHLIQMDPSNPAYYLGFAEVCANTGREQQRREAQRNASLLSELRIILPDANEKNAGAIKKVAAQAENLGLKNAAKDFQLLAAKLGGQMPDQDSPNSFDRFQGPKGP